MALVLHTVVIDSVVSLVIGTSALAYLLCGARLVTKMVRAVFVPPRGTDYEYRLGLRVPFTCRTWSLRWTVRGHE
jgi:hypothetical protein